MVFVNRWLFGEIIDRISVKLSVKLDKSVIYDLARITLMMKIAFAFAVIYSMILSYDTFLTNTGALRVYFTIVVEATLSLD